MAAATAIQNEPMSKDDFQKSKEYLALTSRQRTWLTALMETNDIAQATRTAYGTKNDAYEAMLTRKIESSPRVIAALNLFYGRSERDAFLSELDRTIQREKGPAKVAAMQLKARLQFSRDSETPAVPTKEPEPTEAHRFKVGERCKQNGQTYRVTSVDAEGRILDAEETE
jgi:hypothetical protein